MATKQANSSVSATENAISIQKYQELNLELENTRKQLAQREQQMRNMETELTALRQNKNATPVADNSAAEKLQAQVNELDRANSLLVTQNNELKQTSEGKDSRIEQLETELQKLRNNRNIATAASQRSAPDANLRSELQQSETRYAALLRSNKELKRNNEYLTAQLNALQAKR
jgi:chromosome segregation ATPase